jgi:hypothetical protein
MKVSGASGVGPAGGPGKARPASGGFQLPQATGAAGPAQAARAASVAGVMSVDALLALQDVGGPLERKRRAVRRAGRILDILEEVKLGLLSGEVTSGHLDKLMVAVREQRDGTEDEKLEGVLNEIETRAAVEMAKLERARRAS